MEKTLRVFAFLLCTAPAFALQAIHDARYSLAPEVLIPEQAQFSAGTFTNFEGDLTLRSNTSFGISDAAEVGAWFAVPTWDRFGDALMFLGIGGKYALSSYQALLVDLQAGLNNDVGPALIAGYVQRQQAFKRISLVYEGHVGFLRGVVPTDGLCAWELSATPRLAFGKAVTVDIGLPMSSSLKHPVDHFQFDLAPSVLLQLQNNWFARPAFSVGFGRTDSWRLGIDVGTPL